MANKGSNRSLQDYVLSPSQAQVLGVVKALSRQKGFSPSLDEIGAALGVTKGTVRALLIRLERKGAIRRVPGQFRSIAVLERAA